MATIQAKLVLKARQKLVLARQAIDRGDVFEMALCMYEANGLLGPILAGTERKTKPLTFLVAELRTMADQLELAVDKLPEQEEAPC